MRGDRSRSPHRVGVLSASWCKWKFGQIIRSYTVNGGHTQNLNQPFYGGVSHAPLGSFHRFRPPQRRSKSDGRKKRRPLRTKQGFPFSILIHSRTDTRGVANAKFEPEFEPEGPFHCAATEALAAGTNSLAPRWRESGDRKAASASPPACQAIEGARTAIKARRNHNALLYRGRTFRIYGCSPIIVSSCTRRACTETACIYSNFSLMLSQCHPVTFSG